MLNLGLDVQVDVNLKRVEYPVMFERKNICIHCGAEKTLIFVDALNRETNKEIHPFDHIMCRACGTNYSILWQRDDETGKMFPTATDDSFKREFINLVNHNKIKNKGVKEF